ncbi:winged helix-turn-helix transcriptional regulator [Nocardia goodfellowii]|uniref:DNA-binding HxlR family transcriptional regulator n=1 Tax=Nocardia goodfellowii TaxID=882446 RepID=A0ABS4QN14_9NOCA|nr:winged helix-turn-helix transcriptional regulator [Nocardia goodfellowii]MBP2193095.1 DNA-binding HxlR family transcriptional regulator [Nocardia goodfellowii]
MKPYNQYCALARGLDVIGDRWVLLIVRELLNGPRRYGELAHGLPGIATNLLAARLRVMRTNGLVAKTEDDHYQLTASAEGLREVVSAIAGWAGPLMARMAEDDTFRGHWIAHPVAALFPGQDPTRPDLTIEVRCDEQPMTICSANGEISVHPGQAGAPDLVLTGPPDAAVGLLAHRIDPAEAKSRGLAITGDIGLLRRLRPSVPPARREL